MNDQVITIKCFDHCVYRLHAEAFVDTAGLIKQRKLFGYLVKFDWNNAETIRQLDELLPEMIDEAYAAWQAESQYFADNAKGTARAALPSNMVYAEDIEKEVQSRKTANNKLMAKVKAAKTTYEKRKKCYEAYLAAKGESEN